MARHTPAEVFIAFFRLGCTSFGGPVAHIAYFRNEFVRRRHWLDEALFAEIVAFCQMIPGPGSSQAAFIIGLVTGGWRGALAAWTAFTTPSAILMLSFALTQASLRGAVAGRLIHGLQLAAVGVVAQAVLGMRKTLAPEWLRIFIAFLAGAFVFLTKFAASQLVAIAFGALAGYVLLKGRTGSEPPPLHIAISRRVGWIWLCIFTFLFTLPLGVMGAIYRTGALVFGGGHVVLPLLQNVTVARGLLDEKTFLAGYAVAQAIPGPMFTFAAYLGAVLRQPPNGILGGILALIAMFLPGMLLVVGVLPFWASVRSREWLRSSLAGVNAAVVGILAAAFCRPVWTSAVATPADFAIAASVFLALVYGKCPPWLAVLLAALLALASK